MKHNFNLTIHIIITACLLLGSNFVMAQTSDPLFINQAGNVGVGTVTPATKLHIAGTGSTEISLQSTSTDGRRFTLESRPPDSSVTAMFQIIDRNAGVCRLGIDKEGRIGINTSKPGTTLDVIGNINASDTIYAKRGLRADGESFLYTNGTKDFSNNVVLRRNANDAYIFPWGTGTPSNAVVIGGWKNTNFIVTGQTQLRGGVSVTEGNVTFNGSFVGIGTNNPVVPLEIKGGRNVNPGRFRYFSQKTYNGDGYLGHDAGAQWSISLLADNVVLANQFFANSDSRIKKSLKQADPVEDLKVINKLTVTDYQYKDAGVYGTNFNKGFIAQDVEKVLPSAVSKRSNFIPDIYEIAEHTSLSNGVLTISMPKAHGLVKGDYIRLINKDYDTKDYLVAESDATSFKIAGWTGEYDKLFVFGKKVDDFRAVDYQQIFSLGISAIQGLSNQMEVLKQDNKSLQTDNSKLQKSVSDLEARLELLEKQMTKVMSRKDAAK